MADDVIDTVTTESIGEHLKTAGCRVAIGEREGTPQIASATQGVSFVVRFGNQAAVPGHFLDCTFGCAVKVEGELPAEFVGEWNRTRRFARLWEQNQLLVLEMDIMAAGGVRPAHIATMIELWDRLVAEYVDYIRRARPRAANAS